MHFPPQGDRGLQVYCRAASSTGRLASLRARSAHAAERRQPARSAEPSGGTRELGEKRFARNALDVRNGSEGSQARACRRLARTWATTIGLLKLSSSERRVL